MKNEELKNCPLCENRCPIDAPACGRGRELHRLINEDSLPARQEFPPKEPRDFRPPTPPMPPRPNFGPRPFHGPRFEHGDPEGFHSPRPEHGGPEGFCGPRPPRGPEGFRPPHFGRPPLPEDDSLSLLLMRASHRLHRGGGNIVQERIVALLAREGTLSQQMLQEHLHIRPGSMSEILSKLEAKGLILRERDESDKRKVTLSLTEKGKAAAQKGEVEKRDAAFDALTDEERASLRALLEKLLGEPKKETAE